MRIEERVTGGNNFSRVAHLNREREIPNVHECDYHERDEETELSSHPLHGSRTRAYIGTEICDRNRVVRIPRKE
jgi:hypothetical protein